MDTPDADIVIHMDLSVEELWLVKMCVKNVFQRVSDPGELLRSARRKLYEAERLHQSDTAVEMTEPELDMIDSALCMALATIPMPGRPVSFLDGPSPNPLLEDDGLRLSDLYIYKPEIKALIRRARHELCSALLAKRLSALKRGAERAELKRLAEEFERLRPEGLEERLERLEKFGAEDIQSRFELQANTQRQQDGQTTGKQSFMQRLRIRGCLSGLLFFLGINGFIVGLYGLITTGVGILSDIGDVDWRMAFWSLVVFLVALFLLRITRNPDDPDYSKWILRGP